jgi:hypothetical protein
VIYGGVEGDTTTVITAAQAEGKFVIFAAAPGANAPGGGGGRGGGGGSVMAQRYPNAVAVATVNLDALSPAARLALNDPPAAMAGGRGGGRGGAGTSPNLIVTNEKGGIAVVNNGRLVSGTLPAGQSAADVQREADQARQAAAVAAAGTAVRRDSLASAARAFAAAGLRSGTFTFYGETVTLDSAQIATLSSVAGGIGGRGGRGAGAAPGGRGVAPPAAATGVAAAGAGAAGTGRAGAPGGRGAAPAGAADAPVAVLRITTSAANALLGKNIRSARVGDVGGTVSGTLDYQEVLTNYGRNVVAIVRGSDPVLRGQIVALGAHNDHVGFTTPVDHDSLKAFNDALMKLRITNELRAVDVQQRSQVRVNMDSIRRLHPVPRMDSVNNGADDDGSGSMAILEIAEAISKMPVKPKRTTLFVWHTGEESGLVGSAYYANNPTVPIDSVVAAINLDMVGRGRAEDMIGGGPTYLGAVGSRRLSIDLNREMLDVNAKQATPLNIDYRFDDPTLGLAVDGKPAIWAGYNNIYGRSDHANYANKCVPIAFFFTGLHGDYHQRTDEPQYIDYPHYAMITSFIRDLAVSVANRPLRPSLDKACTRS